MRWTFFGVAGNVGSSKKCVGGWRPVACAPDRRAMSAEEEGTEISPVIL